MAKVKNPTKVIPGQVISKRTIKKSGGDSDTHNIRSKPKTKKKKVKKDKFAVELVDKFDDKDLCDDCLMCQAEKFRNKYDKYPNPQELAEFLKCQK